MLAGITVALADMTWAVLWVRARHGASALRVFQSVASGLLGPSAFQGGWRLALLGLTLHTTIAFAWTLVFLVALVRSPHLRHWVSTRRGAVTVGLVYGALVWLVMDWLVLPLSRARTTPPTALWFWLQLLTHPFLVGLPIVGVLAGHLPRRVVPSTRPAGMGDGRAHR
ncbi:MAG: hypothetical protein ACXWLA_09485 [Myxococcaceae bacterium]